MTGRRSRKYWRTRRWLKAAQALEKAWVESTCQTLASEAALRLPGLPSVPPVDALEPLTGLARGLADTFEPSRVALWAMYQQVRQVFGTTTVIRMTGMDPKWVPRFASRLSPVTGSEARSLWFLWSLIFCPANVANSFTIDTWGYFVRDEALWVKRFESDRILRGFGDAVFGAQVAANHVTGVRGAIHYLSSDRSTVAQIEPAFAVKVRTGRRRTSLTWLQELFDLVDTGQTQEQTAETMGVTQAYVSILSKQRASIFPHMLRVMAVESPWEGV